MKKYKYLLFDADNTLFDFDKSEHEALLLTLKAFSLPTDDVTLATFHSINDALWKSLERGEITQSELRVERFRQLLEAIHANEELANAMNCEYVKNLSEMRYTLDTSESVLEQLSSEYRIIIITNGIYEVQSKRISASSLHNYITDIFVSEKVGYSKPAKEFFDFVLRSIGDPLKTNYLVIGDSLTSDIKGAVNSGIDSVWFNPHKKQNNVVPSMYTVNKLTELLPLLLV